MAKNSIRPVRLNSFQVRCTPSEEFNQKECKKKLFGEYVTKSDVHYCAEKEAIDIVNERISAGIGDEFVYLIYKVSKERDKNDNPKEFTFVSVVYMDNNTNQVVID